jgi:hypothetical protein
MANNTLLHPAPYLSLPSMGAGSLFASQPLEHRFARGADHPTPKISCEAVIAVYTGFKPIRGFSVDIIIGLTDITLSPLQSCFAEEAY